LYDTEKKKIIEKCRRIKGEVENNPEYKR